MQSQLMIRRVLATVLTVALTSLGLVAVATATGAQNSDLEPRIVNGSAAALGEIPHQVLILFDGLPHCGGSIVAPSTVLSAAHCFEPGYDDPALFTVRAGVLDARDAGGQDRQVSRILNHPGDGLAGRGEYPPDVSILNVAVPFTFNGAVAPVGLAQSSDIVYGGAAVVSGWGALGEYVDAYPDNLLKADLTLIDDATCEASLAAEEPGTTIDDPNELCASSSPGDSCYGDSGGPLTIQTAAGARLAGIVSWGLLCGPPSPGIYVEVPAHLEWVAVNAGEPLSGTLAGANPIPTPAVPPIPIAPSTPAPSTPMPSTPTLCNGLTVTVNLAAGQLPSDGDDVIAGTPGDDLIAAGLGNDTVCGGGGNDTIWGQAGDDTILGETGDDKLRGGSGNDTIMGGDGADDLSGGRGDDVIDGGAGSDLRVRGGTGNDVVDGGDGDDPLVSGNGGSDVVHGGAGNDKVTGGPRPDEVHGDAGDDELRGHRGADLLNGGAGNDRLFGGAQPDDLVGGEGTDECNGGTTGEGAVEGDTASECEGALINVP